MASFCGGGSVAFDAFKMKPWTAPIPAPALRPAHYYQVFIVLLIKIIENDGEKRAFCFKYPTLYQCRWPLWLCVCLQNFHPLATQYTIVSFRYVLFSPVSFQSLSHRNKKNMKWYEIRRYGPAHRHTLAIDSKAGKARVSFYYSISLMKNIYVQNRLHSLVERQELRRWKENLPIIHCE